MRIRLFFSALALTLLLLLPMVGLVEYFAMQRQMQERVRRANAAGTAVQVDPASRYMGSLLLAVQKEEPEFILLRMDAPAATLTLCGLPGNMQLAAPSGTHNAGPAAYLAAGPGTGRLSCWGYPWYRPATLPCGHAPAAMPAFGSRAPPCGWIWPRCRRIQTPTRTLWQKSRLPLPKPLCVIWGQGRLMPEQPAVGSLHRGLIPPKPPAACRPARPGTGRPVPAF